MTHAAGGAARVREGPRGWGHTPELFVELAPAWTLYPGGQAGPVLLPRTRRVRDAEGRRPALRERGARTGIATRASRV